MFSVNTSSPERTWEVGQLVGTLLEAGDTICLYGDLGAGKTNFAYGIAKGMGVKEQYVTSPTFSFVNEYHGRLPLYHMDLYRIKHVEELEGIGFKDYIRSDGVTVIEWADRAEDELPSERLSVYLSHLDEHGREIGFLGEGDRYEQLVGKIRLQIAAAVM
jgi:tRNA threonylcarbamoyladenosine biosynthesis protein TsaE